MSTVERVHIQSLFLAACSNYPPWCKLDDDIRNRHVIMLERGCNNTAVLYANMNNIPKTFADDRFKSYYSLTASKLLANIDVTSSVGSTHLIQALIDNVYHPGVMSDLSSVDMCPDASSSERSEILLRSNIEPEVQPSKLYKCRCGSNKITTDEYQTRKADELPTIVAVCETCGAYWRIQ
jgi:hypothetical protein